jgi:hypothetical protein
MTKYANKILLFSSFSPVYVLSDSRAQRDGRPMGQEVPRLILVVTSEETPTDDGGGVVRNPDARTPQQSRRSGCLNAGTAVERGHLMLKS